MCAEPIAFFAEINRLAKGVKMEYKLSKKYDTDKFMSMIMGPNPIKLCEELLLDCKYPPAQGSAISEAVRG